MTTTVVNIRDGFVTGDAYIGRPRNGLDSEFGNPFVVGRHGDRGHVIHLFRNYFERRVESDSAYREAVESLRGRRLTCFCKPLACHGDVIAEYLNREEGNDAP